MKADRDVNIFCFISQFSAILWHSELTYKHEMVVLTHSAYTSKLKVNICFICTFDYLCCSILDVKQLGDLSPEIPFGGHHCEVDAEWKAFESHPDPPPPPRLFCNRSETSETVLTH